jgi:hypothetical protein
MNLFDPVAKTWTNARTITLVVADEEGNPLAPTVKAQVVKLLEELREVNWVIHVIDPSYVTVPATFQVVAFAGQSMETVKAACVAALTEALSPADYRLGEMSPATEGGEVINPPVGEAKPRQQTIYMNELVALLDRTLGVDRVVGVTINGVAKDFVMATSFTLPKPGAITGTVEGGAA